MNWFPSWEGILISSAVMTIIRALWIWQKYPDHRLLRFIGWPEPYRKRPSAKEIFWSGTSGVTRSEVEKALSPEYVARYGWLMTPRARRIIIVANVLVWTLVIYGGFDLPGGLGMDNSGLSLWGLFTIPTWWAARASARIIPDAPDELLDERLLQVRNAVYYNAYRLLGVFVSISVVVAIGLDISITNQTQEVGGADWTSLIITVPFVSIWALSTLPHLVLIAGKPDSNT